MSKSQDYRRRRKISSAAAEVTGMVVGLTKRLRATRSRWRIVDNLLIIARVLDEAGPYSPSPKAADWTRAVAVRDDRQIEAALERLVSALTALRATFKKEDDRRLYADTAISYTWDAEEKIGDFPWLEP
ncbi:MAG: hypothetical protein ACM3WU_04225 [Bacillota bacterium]